VGAELFVEPIPGAAVVTKDRFDCWQSAEFVRCLDSRRIDGLIIGGLIIGGVELVCCVLYAVLGAAERGYRYLVPEHLVSGQDTGDETDNRAVRDWLRFNQPKNLVEDESQILARWAE